MSPLKIRGHGQGSLTQTTSLCPGYIIIWWDWKHYKTGIIFAMHTKGEMYPIYCNKHFMPLQYFNGARRLSEHTKNNIGEIIYPKESNWKQTVIIRVVHKA